MLLGFIVIAFNPFVVPSKALELPELREAVSPTIPKLIFIARIKTEVVLQVEIATSGIVKSAHATAGHPLLRTPTENAALQWRFQSSPDTQRSLTLTFVYNYTSGDLDNSLKVLPYGVKLTTKLSSHRGDLDNSLKVLPYGAKLTTKLFSHPRSQVSRLPQNLRSKRTSCELHNQILRIDVVRIVYGLIRFPDGYFEAKASRFPHSESASYGGCVIDDDSPTFAEVLYCAECRHEEGRWSRSRQTNDLK